MLSSSGHGPLRLALGQAGGCLQHARSLLAALGGDAASQLPEAACSSSGEGRSISTTRSIYMGRAFVRENLEKSAAKSSLFTRENYQYLAKHRWSLTACEQVLSKHQRARKPPRSFPMRELTNAIKATASMDELQQLVADRAHDMTGVHLSVAIQQTALLLNNRTAPNYTAAALLLHSLGTRLPGQMGPLNGPSICNCLASFVRCRYSPPGELLQAMLDELLANSGEKLQQTHVVALSHLVYALSRLVQPQGHWPLLQAVLEQTVVVLQELTEEASGFAAGQQRAARQVQQHLDRLEGSTRSASSASGPGASGGAADASADAAGSGDSDANAAAPAAVPAPDAAAAAASAAPAGDVQLASGQAGAAPTVHSAAYIATGANSAALLLYTLEKAGVSSREVADALHVWMAVPGVLDVLRPNALMQLWSVLRSQHSGRLAAAAASEAAPGEAATDDLQPHGDAGDGAGDGAAAASAVLPALARATASKLPYFKEREAGQVLAALAALRYDDPELLAAVAATIRTLADAGLLTPATSVTAAVAATRLRCYKPELLQPALRLAARSPRELDGAGAGRLLYAAAALPADVAAAQAALVDEALHAASDARGPVPERPAGSNAAWVDALADNVAARLAELKPREVAHVLDAFSLLPGVQLHAGLFGAAARHVEAHAHMFSRGADVELVAAAFERMSFREGLPALKALQQQTLGTAAAAAQP